MVLSHDGLERIQARIGQKAGHHGLFMYCEIKLKKLQGRACKLHDLVHHFGVKSLFFTEVIAFSHSSLASQMASL